MVPPFISFFIEIYYKILEINKFLINLEIKNLDHKMINLVNKLNILLICLG
jgi:hypothetical protein